MRREVDKISLLHKKQLLFLLALWFALTQRLSATPQDLSKARSISSQVPTAHQIAQNSFRSLVLLVMHDRNNQPVSLGSGFFVAEGVIATNFHVVQGTAGGYAKLIGQSTKYEVAGIVGLDFVHDLVLVSAPEAKAPAFPLGESKEPAVGDEVYVVGNPRGLEGTFSQGIVSGIRKMGSESLIQITAPISPGSSGGPVLNNLGKAIGVAALTYKGGQNLNFAIPISYLAALLSSRGPVKALSEVKPPATEQSIFSAFGEGGTAGVIGHLFVWDSEVSEFFSFTLENKLRESVKNVSCLVIFDDWKERPVDVRQIQFPGVIPAGLGARVTGYSAHSSVKELTTARDSYGRFERTPATKVEIRILDFELVE